MSDRPSVRIGTRESRLALAQTAIVVELLRPLVGESSVVPIRTRGDATSARRPRGSWVDSDGQFTRELEQALLDDHVDLVVHSLKDLPTEPVEGLTIGAVIERGDPRDCLIVRGGGTIDDLPFGARIGTSSPRRAAQLAVRRSDLIAMPLRGNVETRLRRLERGEFDGLLLAAAGLDRLGIAIPASARLPFETMLPAPAQGALAIQLRSSDPTLARIVAHLDHGPTRIAVEAERALLRRVGGGCLAPLGALGDVENNRLHLRAAYEDPDGRHVRAEASGPADDPTSTVERVAVVLEQELATA